MLTLCQRLEGKYLSNDVLPKVQLLLFVKELQQEELGLWFLAFLPLPYWLLPLEVVARKKKNKITQIYQYYKNILKSKQSFDEISPSSAQKIEELGSLHAHSSLRCLEFGFFPSCLGSEFSDTGLQGLQGDFWAGAHLEGKEEIQTLKVSEKERLRLKKKWKRCLQQGD